MWRVENGILCVSIGGFVVGSAPDADFYVTIKNSTNNVQYSM